MFEMYSHIYNEMGELMKLEAFVRARQERVGNVTQTAGKEPFSGGEVGSLGVHIDEPIAFFDGDQIVFGLPVGIVRALTPDLRPGSEQFSASACVLDMADFHLPVDLHVSDKTVGPVDKNAGHHVFVMHMFHLLVYMITVF